MNLNEYLKTFQPAIEGALKEAVQMVDSPLYYDLYRMMTYHMGWEIDKSDTGTKGKRIRPVLLLLCTASAGGDWKNALPAAASVELIHNFSLLHDDIEDKSILRRGRPTIWTKWGIPQAINTGDSLFSIAHLTMVKLEETSSTTTAFIAAKIIQKTCLELTQGQHLDISYENRHDLAIDDYWSMITGKTAALIAACCKIGALIATATEEKQAFYQTFGLKLGLAFQVLDDLLGIWGDAEMLGKSNLSDLVTRKKTLPILYGLNQQGLFFERWEREEIKPAEVPEIAKQLENEGARDYTQEIADQLTKEALESLDKAAPVGDAGIALRQLASQLLQREV